MERALGRVREGRVPEDASGHAGRSAAGKDHRCRKRERGSYSLGDDLRRIPEREHTPRLRQVPGGAFSFVGVTLGADRCHGASCVTRCLTSDGPGRKQYRFTCSVVVRHGTMLERKARDSRCSVHCVMSGGGDHRRSHSSTGQSVRLSTGRLRVRPSLVPSYRRSSGDGAPGYEPGGREFESLRRCAYREWCKRLRTTGCDSVRAGSSPASLTRNVRRTVAQLVRARDILAIHLSVCAGRRHEGYRNLEVVGSSARKRAPAIGPSHTHIPARMGNGRAPPGTVAQRAAQSSAPPHDLPLPDEGRSAQRHDARMRVQIPPARFQMNYRGDCGTVR